MCVGVSVSECVLVRVIGNESVISAWKVSIVVGWPSSLPIYWIQGSGRGTGDRKVVMRQGDSEGVSMSVIEGGSECESS